MHQADYLLALNGNQATLETELVHTSVPPRQKNWFKKPLSKGAVAASRRQPNGRIVLR